MESLSVNEIIKNSSILYDFLTIEKEADFMNKKKEYQKFKAPAKLNEIRTLSGEVIQFLILVEMPNFQRHRQCGRRN